MKISTWVAGFNFSGAVASIEFEDESCTVYKSKSNKDVNKACLEAAKALREAADKFDKMAALPDIAFADVQEKFNKTKSTKY